MMKATIEAYCESVIYASDFMLFIQEKSFGFVKIFNFWCLRGQMYQKHIFTKDLSVNL